jgi:hypothetical protein
VLALYRSGRQADAFQEARRMIADELGLEPGPELRRLQEAILAHDPAIAAVPVARRRRGNLPAPAASFVGREKELGQVPALLHEHRLVTLTGPPGVGKSRLAVETARSLEPDFPDGIWLVDFARAGGPDGAVRLLAHAVDARGSDPLGRVSWRLRDADALVVLDACEHVLDEAARIGSTLLADCSRVRIMATSREALRVAGEVRLPVAPLGAAAVDLFLERARSARPGFEPDDEAAVLAAEIARRVDCLPLAIELAAARVNVLGLAEIVSILERRTALLHDSPASDPAAARPSRRSSRLQRRTASMKRPSRIWFLRWSTSRSCRPRSLTLSLATTCSTPSASMCSSAWTRAAGSPRPGRRMRTISRRWPRLHTRGYASRSGRSG